MPNSSLDRSQNFDTWFEKNSHLPCMNEAYLRSFYFAAGLNYFHFFRGDKYLVAPASAFSDRPHFRRNYWGVFVVCKTAYFAMKASDCRKNDRICYSRGYGCSFVRCSQNLVPFPIVHHRECQCVKVLSDSALVAKGRQPVLDAFFW